MQSVVTKKLGGLLTLRVPYPYRTAIRLVSCIVERDVKVIHETRQKFCFSQAN